MPAMGLRETFEMQTRNRYTKVNCELGLKVEGTELPNMAILGEALEQAIEMVQEKVKKSYEVVPERTGDTEHGIANPQAARDNVEKLVESVNPQPPKF